MYCAVYDQIRSEWMNTLLISCVVLCERIQNILLEVALFKYFQIIFFLFSENILVYITSVLIMVGFHVVVRVVLLTLPIF